MCRRIKRRIKQVDVEMKMYRCEDGSLINLDEVVAVLPNKNKYEVVFERSSCKNGLKTVISAKDYKGILGCFSDVHALVPWSREDR